MTSAQNESCQGSAPWQRKREATFSTSEGFIYSKLGLSATRIYNTLLIERCAIRGTVDNNLTAQELARVNEMTIGAVERALRKLRELGLVQRHHYVVEPLVPGKPKFVRITTVRSVFGDFEKVPEGGLGYVIPFSAKCKLVKMTGRGGSRKCAGRKEIDPYGIVIAGVLYDKYGRTIIDTETGKRKNITNETKKSGFGIPKQTDKVEAECLINDSTVATQPGNLDNHSDNCRAPNNTVFKIFEDFKHVSGLIESSQKDKSSGNSLSIDPLNPLKYDIRRMSEGNREQSYKDNTNGDLNDRRLPSEDLTIASPSNREIQAGCSPLEGKIETLTPFGRVEQEPDGATRRAHARDIFFVGMGVQVADSLSRMNEPIVEYCNLETQKKSKSYGYGHSNLSYYNPITSEKTTIASVRPEKGGATDIFSDLQGGTAMGIENAAQLQLGEGMAATAPRMPVNAPIDPDEFQPMPAKWFGSEASRKPRKAKDSGKGRKGSRATKARSTPLPAEPPAPPNEAEIERAEKLQELYDAIKGDVEKEREALAKEHAMGAYSPDGTKDWLYPSRLFSTLKAFERFELLLPPEPLELDERDTLLRRAQHCANLYVNCLKKEYGIEVKTFAYTSMEDSKYRKVMEAAAELLTEYGVAPARWIYHAMELWYYHNKEDTIPPVNFVFARRLIDNHIDNIQYEIGFVPRHRYGPAVVAAQNAYMDAYHEANRLGKQEDKRIAAECWERICPEWRREELCLKAAEEVAMRRYQAEVALEGGEWLW